MSFPADNTILGVICKPLVSHRDGRGFFREVIRSTDEFFPEDGFSQWSHSKMTKDVVKAWHYHHVQFDWWYLPIGQVETVLFDNREESPTYRTKLVFKMGEADKFGSDTYELCVRIPPGVLHGCRVLSEEAHLFYITSEVYNPQDEGRFPFNSPIVDHDWGPNAITAENDRRTFVPTATRKI
ncbi:MAG: dTDP-4-dehydrorhamnose 3,5-epimerase family protein [Bdellovibrionales bacterium]|nr:dTDP-4-dehydrorhamnose 3,5-epimerase family protein [Bdellovibrionales bacterium]